MIRRVVVDMLVVVLAAGLVGFSSTELVESHQAPAAVVSGWV